MIKVINYGVGNIDAFYNIYKRLNIEVGIASKSSELEDADHLILPGVGSFDYAMSMLNQSGMRDALDNKVIKDGVPVIGICVGMQMMAKRSDEGIEPGLGWIDGEVLKFNSYNLLVPEMGWNSVEHNDDFIFSGLPDSPRFYFLHSYYFKCHDCKDVIGTSEYGQSFDSVIRHGNIYGIQCHPEKSHYNGVRLLENFAKIR